MELGTFGAVLKFAMELEEEAISFYEKARNESGKTPMAEHFTALVQRGQKRLDTLERVRRENITEMILEPIAGLDSDAYIAETAIPEGSDNEAIRSMALAIEVNLQKFYTNAAVKVEFLIEAAYSLEALADDNEDTIQNLSGL